MGSAAFLNEAINQLAEAYLTKKQEELGETISYDKRFKELQKVKMFIADRNVYGCDLNPVAVELAEVSLWLNTIYTANVTHNHPEGIKGAESTASAIYMARNGSSKEEIKAYIVNAQ